MPTNVLMPALSPTMTTGNLVKWNVKEGDEVKAGDVIAEIETDKATMEVEAVDEGRVGRIVVPEGTQEVPVNAVIAVLLNEGEDASALGGNGAAASQARAEPGQRGRPGAPGPAAPPQEPAPRPAEQPAASAQAAQGGGAPQATPLAARMAQQAGLDLRAIGGSGPHGKITKADIEAALTRGTGGTGREQGERIFVSPLARRMAAEAGLPLQEIQGSGPGGRIVRRDVEAAAQRPRRPEAAPPSAAAAAPPTAPAAKAPEIPGLPEFELVPHTSMRKVIARRLTESKQTIPHFYLTIDCEVDRLLRARQEINEAAPEGVKLSINDLIIKACALALRRVPDANASWTEEGVRKYKSVDISVAVALPAGLITPVIREADRKGLAEISAEMKDLAARAREGKLKPEEFQGGTFSVSNMGMYGIRQFDAVINPPQACILAIGMSEQRPVVKDGQLAIATMMTCTLSCDHRVVDGALGAQWLAAFKALIEHPATMLL